MTCTNGEGSGVVVPGTGIHLNNIMGEEDLNPLGFFTAPPGRRMPSMMAPTVVLARRRRRARRSAAPGSNRIRSAILQTIVGVVDHGLDAARRGRGAARALRGRASSTPSRASTARAARRAATIVRVPQPNLFFGGVQAVERDPRTGALTGAGDPRRGGVAVAA